MQNEVKHANTFTLWCFNTMTPSKPYLLRALNQWILDNELTPYLLIDATLEHVMVPKEYITDGKIVLNITPGIVTNLMIENSFIEFDARFSGRLRRIYAPMNAVIAIYAKENGKGMVFPEEEEEDEGGAITSSNESSPPPDKPTPPRGKPNLKVIK